MLGRVTLLAIALLSLAACCDRLLAQSTPSEPAEAVGENNDVEGAPPVREVGPHIFMVRDKDGKYHPLLDISLEELRELDEIRQRLRVPERPQKFNLPRLLLTGSADEQLATLDLDLQIQTRSEDWVRIPLRMHQAVVRDVQFKGTGKHDLRFDEKEDGYVLWIQAPGERTHNLKMKVFVPVSQVGAQTRLDLNLPRTTRSELDIRVAAGHAKSVVSEGAVVRILSDGDAETHFHVAGLNGDFRLAWRSGEVAPASKPPIIEAIGEHYVRIEQDRVLTDAKLQVRTQGGEVGTFEVRLPTGARLTNSEFPGYQVQVAESKQGVRRPTATVALSRPITKGNPREIRFSFEIPRDPKKKDPWIDVAGIDVLRASQWGHIVVAADEDWRVDAQPQGNLIEDDEVPDDVPRDGLAAVYKYSGRTYSLRLQIEQREKSVRVTPNYHVQIKSEGVELTAEFDFNLGGAKTGMRDIHLPGWQVQRVELVTDDQSERIDVPLDEVDPLRVFLPRKMRGAFRLRVQARRDRSPDDAQVSFSLPRPVANLVNEASILVQPAENVELTFDTQQSAGLNRADQMMPVDLPEGRQRPLVFRDKGDGQEAVFAAAIAIRQRKVDVGSSSLVHVRDTSVLVQQDFHYDIRYEPLAEVRLLVPAWLADPNKLKLKRNGQEMPWEQLHVVDVPDNDEVRAMEISLAGSRIGRNLIQVEYAVAVSRLKAGKETPLSVSLVQPDPQWTPVGDVRLRLQSDDRITVEVEDAHWKPSKDTQPIQSTGNEAVYSTTQPAMHADLITTLVEPFQHGATVVEKGWHQIWLTPSARQDRAVFQILTNNRGLTIKLPEQVRLEDIIAVVDGQVAPVENRGQGRIALSLAETSASGSTKRRRHVVELSYPFAGGRPPRGLMGFSAPEILESAWVRQMYWQVITPPNEKLIAAPEKLTLEMEQATALLPFQERARLSQRQLELWTGATPQVTPESAGEFSGNNEYLFSSIGSPQAIQLRTTSRAWLLLFASGAALVGGLAVIHLRWLRHRAVLLAAAIVLSALALQWPTMVLPLVKAASLGVLLVLVSRLLQWILARRRRGILWGTAERASGVSSDERGSTQIDVIPEEQPQPPSSTTTGAASLSLPLATPEART